mmetsp:Transcript_11963/g.26088  ORF Transcript_11963/g.26088 Transcript_11963/m.26088 type:complete len:295 (-) Transcript_11963:42-926(-)
MSSRYDRAITVFSPDGHLFQVEYALEAVRKGTTAIGVRGTDSLVLCVEKKSTAKLQEPRTVRKICKLDSHILLAFAGLTADARVLVNKARIECQSYRLTVEDAPSVDYVTRHIAGIQQRYTQSGGVRPFGISTLIVGFDLDGTPRLFQTDPSGTFSEWKAAAIGRNSKTVSEFLEKKYPEFVEENKQVKETGRASVVSGEGGDETEEITTEDHVVKFAVRALLEVVESSAKNIEIAVMKAGQEMKLLEEEEIAKAVASVEAEKKAAEEARKPPAARADPGGAAGSSQPPTTSGQ